VFAARAPTRFARTFLVADIVSRMTIHWPEQFQPGRAPVHVRNVRESHASASAIWAWLVRAKRWPEWYPNSNRVRIEGGAEDLSAGATFEWNTFGVRLASRVEEFVPESRIAWTARGTGVLAYHAWLIEPRSSGATILTEETQYGWLARLGHFLMPHRMHAGHDLWLEELHRMASNGLPAPPA
jgi:hypothetical protein